MIFHFYQQQATPNNPQRKSNGPLNVSVKNTKGVEPKDSVRLRAAEMMGKHYGLFTDRIETVGTERSAAEIQIELEEKLQQFLLPEASS